MKYASEKYAEALFKAAKNLECVETVAEELKAADELLGQCARHLNTPQIGIKKKSALIQEALSDVVGALTLEFVMLMVQRRQLAQLPAVTRCFKKMSDQFLGKVTISLHTPFELDEETLNLMKVRLISDGLIPNESAEKVLFEIILDKEIIGGFIARRGGHQIDASLKTALTKLHRSERYGIR